MLTRFDRTVILTPLPHTRTRYAAWLGSPRVRAGATATVVVLVPGAWVVWLAWQVLKRARGVPASDARGA